MHTLKGRLEELYALGDSSAKKDATLIGGLEEEVCRLEGALNQVTAFGDPSTQNYATSIKGLEEEILRLKGESGSVSALRDNTTLVDANVKGMAEEVETLKAEEVERLKGSLHDAQVVAYSTQSVET